MYGSEKQSWFPVNPARLPFGNAIKPCKSAGGMSQSRDGRTSPRDSDGTSSEQEAVATGRSATNWYSVAELPVFVL